MSEDDKTVQTFSKLLQLAFDCTVAVRQSVSGLRNADERSNADVEFLETMVKHLLKKVGIRNVKQPVFSSRYKKTYKQAAALSTLLVSLVDNIPSKDNIQSVQDAKFNTLKFDLSRVARALVRVINRLRGRRFMSSPRAPSSSLVKAYRRLQQKDVQIFMKAGSGDAWKQFEKYVSAHLKGKSSFSQIEQQYSSMLDAFVKGRLSDEIEEPESNEQLSAAKPASPKAADDVDSTSTAVHSAAAVAQKLAKVRITGTVYSDKKPPRRVSTIIDTDNVKGAKSFTVKGDGGNRVTVSVDSSSPMDPFLSKSKPFFSITLGKKQAKKVDLIPPLPDILNPDSVSNPTVYIKDLPPGRYFFTGKVTRNGRISGSVVPLSLQNPPPPSDPYGPIIAAKAAKSVLKDVDNM